eukprot:TRINITY_DN104861_c0_g1_i1.p1 TRINITY_DN104861_c0_g1~~TRINITY_DN104861_c0_g1_i1.p1  ORF type:complete len:357 (-),score=78.82 TRINITY_DN104861_c0_g1_i1:101-1171(-)
MISDSLRLAQGLYQDAIGRNAQLVFHTGSWMVCSVGMLVFNKLAVRAFPLPCTLVAIQMLFSVLVLLVFFYKDIHIGSVRDAMRWSMVVPFFLGMLLTSMFALRAAPMSLVITFRALSPLFSLAAEQFYPSPPAVTLAFLWPLLIIVFGAWCYAKDMDHSSMTWAGVGWVMLNSAFAVADRLLQYLFLGKDQQPVDISKIGVTLLNNLLGMFPLAFVALYVEEHQQWLSVYRELNTVGIFWIVCSCVVGVGISFTGILVQSLISATSFLVLINANKFVIILLEVSYLHDTKKLTPLQVFGALVAVFGSIVYGYVKGEADKRRAQDKAAVIDFENGEDEEKEPMIRKAQDQNVGKQA